ncbi:MAG: hypothetical protein AAF468_07155 [Pseudomonadota bacterium]
MVEKLKSTPAAKLRWRHYPVLVAFDDTSKPETIKRIDPDDLDATLGCPRDLASDHPWRAQGMSWQNWMESEAVQRSIELAGAKASIPIDAADAAKYMYLSHVRHRPDSVRFPPYGSRTYWTYDQAQAYRKKVAHKAPYESERKPEYFEKWRASQKPLLREFLSKTPDTSKDCFRLSSIMVELTDESVTTGRLKNVPTWFKDNEQLNSVWNSLSRSQRRLFSSFFWKRDYQ